MRIGSLCSGIGLMELGLEWAGLGETVWQVEIDPFCRAVLAKHWPDAKRYDDVRAVKGEDLDSVDLVCFGSPCQDLSSAGGRAGLHGPKSRIFFDCARVVGEVRPEWVVFENVASGAARWVDAVRCELGKLRYASLPVPVAASDCGAPHRRARVFLVAHLDVDREPVVAVDAEVARTSAVADGADGAVVREERSETRELAVDGVAAPANPDSVISIARARKARPQRSGRTITTRSDWGRSTEPDMVRVVHGRADGLDTRRIAALGNSCVPQQAEVVGRVIRMLIEGAA